MAKMTNSERKQFFLKALGEQRHLLRTAIESMASGDLTQALRVAASIRVLVHETGNSKPLLKSVHPDYLNLPILDRTVERPKNLPQGVGAVVFYCPISAKVSASGKVSLAADLDANSYQQSVIGRWWKNTCMVLPGIGPVTRRELILGLVNKEGGAHVDADMPEKYRLLLESHFVEFNINGIDLGPLNVSRLVAGKSGGELLDCLDKNFPPQ